MEIVSFVILHYRDLETTDLCVRSIRKLKQQERVRIVIVDNDVRDTPEQRRRIQKKYEAFPEVTVLQAKEDRGFSYANNLGYAYAREQQGASFILVLNNDIELLQEDFIERLDRAYREHPCAVMGPDVIRAGTQEHQNPLGTRLRTAQEARRTAELNRRALKLYDLLYPFLFLNQTLAERRSLRERKRREAYYQAPHEDVVLFGAFLIYTPVFIEKETAAFWPETNFYYEEYILACRCKRNRYKMVYVPDLKALHESGKATRTSFAGGKKRLRFVMERVTEASGIYLDYLQQSKRGTK